MSLVCVPKTCSTRTRIVTVGGRGARLVTAEEVQVIDPVPVDPVDTTGAGDAFIGSFARYAAHSITGHGTQSSYADSAAFDSFCRVYDA